MLVWNCSDHFVMAAHPQYVGNHSQCLCDVTLTILWCLCIHREWVIILNACVKLLWPFYKSVHPQDVGNPSQCLCDVILTILWCLCILRLCVFFFPKKFILPTLCILSKCVIFLQLHSLSIHFSLLSDGQWCFYKLFWNPPPYPIFFLSRMSVWI